MTDCERLIREFCALMHLGDPESIARGTPLDVNGITCSITKARHDDAHALVLYCEFGSLPSGREAAIQQELLAQNFLGAPDGGAMFGYSPVAGHVICIQHLRASAITAQRLADILHHLAEKAAEWRQNYFLKPALQAGPREAGAVPSATRAALSGARSAAAHKGPR